MQNNEKNYHFISGLPRSGSTLLTTLLAQNPNFCAKTSDLLYSVVTKTLAALSENKTPSEQQAKNTLRGLFEGFYLHAEQKTIFNTNFQWGFLTHVIANLHPNSKFIFCVDDLNKILNSFELAFRRNLFVPTQQSHTTSVYGRTDQLMESNGVVGSAYIALKQAISGEQRSKIMIVEHKQLLSNPEGVLRALYAFINEEYYNHVFANVPFLWDEHDVEYTESTEITTKIEYKEPTIILPPDIMNKYSGMEVWRK